MRIFILWNITGRTRPFREFRREFKQVISEATEGY